jgi:hypothetical protein
VGTPARISLIRACKYNTKTRRKFPGELAPFEPLL